MAKQLSADIQVNEKTATGIPSGRDAAVTISITRNDGHAFGSGQYDLIPKGVPELLSVDFLGKKGSVTPGVGAFQLDLESDAPTIELRLVFRATSLKLGDNPFTLSVKGPRTSEDVTGKIEVFEPQTLAPTRVSKEVAATSWTNNIALFALIQQSTAALGFDNYKRHMDLLLCGEGTADPKLKAKFYSLKRRSLPFTDTDAYRILKVATEAFVAVKSAVDPDTLSQCGTNEALFGDPELQKIATAINATVNPPGSHTESFKKDYLEQLDDTDRILPYLAIIRSKLADLPIKDEIFPIQDHSEANLVKKCVGVLREKLACPVMVELIWSYWHEQGMQVQTMFAIRNRFQNRRSGPGPDPLSAMEIGYLRPLNNVLWGYIQDEQHRLTLLRRCYEYDHHYGLKLQGAAVPKLEPADSRAKFLEAFHNLLYLCTIFFKEDDDTNRKADAFPVLNAIKEVHFLLSEGAQNQFGDLPVTARIEMLLEQWLLARPEMAQFLPARESVAYPEPWMGPVDSMKTVQGWTNTSVMYFHDLAVFGEQILLSVRYNNWSQVFDRESAANWARIWRSQIQGYMHAYRTVSSVDLGIEPNEPRLQERRLDPSVLLLRRLEEQRRIGGIARGGMRLPPTPTAGLRLPAARR